MNCDRITYLRGSIGTLGKAIAELLNDGDIEANGGKESTGDYIEMDGEATEVETIAYLEEKEESLWEAYRKLLPSNRTPE